MWTYNYTYTTELYHHGIKGQKWGVRRFQNKDGSLTNAGRKRYLNDPTVQKSKAEYDSAKIANAKARRRYNTISSYDNYQRYNETQSNYKNAKFKYKTAKEAARIRENDISFDNKSKHRLKLEESYKKLGLNDEEAQAAANNRIRTEKILAASAAVTVAACAAYVANGKIRDRLDSVIKSGDTLQRIEMRDTNGQLNDMFYVAKGKHDSKRYAGLLGFTRQQQTGEAYLMKLKAEGDVRVASTEKARKAFEDLYRNDASFRNSVKDNIGEHFTGQTEVDTTKLSKRNMKKMYENFNSSLIDIRESGSGADKKFYDKLKSSGYGAIQDVNDKKFSGYNARDPLIVFDNSKKNITVQTVSKMTDQKSAAAVEREKIAAETFVETFAKRAIPLTAVGLTAKTAETYLADPYKEQKKGI